jgi:hypothetical protein
MGRKLTGRTHDQAEHQVAGSTGFCSYNGIPGYMDLLPS